MEDTNGPTMAVVGVTHSQATAPFWAWLRLGVARCACSWGQAAKENLAYSINVPNRLRLSVCRSCGHGVAN